jgi:putative transposase
MIDRGHDLALATQADLLGVARSTLNRQPRPIPAADLAVMRRIDELHLDYPFAGSRMMRDMLVNEGVLIGRTHVRTLMRRMGIEALYRRPRTSKPAPAHKVYPYLLRDLAIERPNQVWARTSLTFQWPGDLSIWSWCWTGSAAGLCRGESRSRWRLTFASKPSRKPWPGMANPTSSTRIGEPVHQRRIHRFAVEQQDRDQHGWQGCVA